MLLFNDNIRFLSAHFMLVLLIELDFVLGKRRSYIEEQGCEFPNQETLKQMRFSSPETFHTEPGRPSLEACNYPIFLSWRFNRTFYFQFEFTANLDLRMNLSDQSQARTWLTTSFHRNIKKKNSLFFLTDMRSCKPELTYLVGIEA